MGTWIVAGDKDIIKLSNSAFASLSSTIEDIIEKSDKQYSENLSKLVDYMNELGTHYVDLDRYLLHNTFDIQDFIDLVKMSIQVFESNPYWNNPQGQRILQNIVENLKEYSLKIHKNLES